MMATTGAADDMLSGRIDNFKDSMGRYISTDTRAKPNDPDTRWGR